jgi:hypothetical protein
MVPGRSGAADGRNLKEEMLADQRIVCVNSGALPSGFDYPALLAAGLAVGWSFAVIGFF